MISESKVKKFVDSLQTLHLYSKVRGAFVDVLKKLSEDEFRKVTEDVVFMVLHEGAFGQVMHFAPKKKKFKVVQLSIPETMPVKIIRFIIAHELGHVFQDRNWEKSDGSKLEVDADSFAEKLGFPFEPSFKKWMNTERIIK